MDKNNATLNFTQSCLCGYPFVSLPIRVCVPVCRCTCAHVIIKKWTEFCVIKKSRFKNRIVSLSLKLHFKIWLIRPCLL